MKADLANSTHSGTARGAVPRRYRHPQEGNWHVQLTQGETFVTDASDEVLTTVLGSCVAACIRDPVVAVGGMNHFLLPDGNDKHANALCYGINAMELLINGIMKRGGVRSRMEAKLFGGANVMATLSEIGSRNAEFARRFLTDEGIRIVGGDLGGVLPRRIEYWPVTGRARQMTVGDEGEEVIRQELAQSGSRWTNHVNTDDGDVELF
jgi:chemotaxis protein CheD